MNKKDVFNKYVDLTKKLGKFPSQRVCAKFGIGKDSIHYHYDKISKLKNEVIKLYPHLEDLQMSVKVNDADIEAYRLDEEKKKVSKQNKATVQSHSTLDYIAEYAKNVFSGRVKSTKVPVSKKPTKRIINLVLSDLHFGADVDKEETGVLNYGKVEESRRLAHVVKETINYKKEYRDETELKVLLLGDLLQGQLHDARDGAPMAEQVCRAIHLLIQAVTKLSQNFKNIEVICQTGNHGRIMSRHAKRAVNQKWDSYETIIAYSVKEACSNLKNVSFRIDKTPYSIYKVFEQKILATHGDGMLNTGFPGSSINTKSLENQLNKINASLHDKDEIKVAIAGHVHTGNITYLSNGSVILTNGSLIPVDEYAVSLGMLESNAGQMLFESTPNFAMGDNRFIRVGKEQDEDGSLDAIIASWKCL